MKNPNFFIIGAPKCGTTSLATWLGSHPQIYFSPNKEPHYFYSPYGQSMVEKEYLSLFDAANASHAVCAEKELVIGVEVEAKAQLQCQIEGLQAELAVRSACDTGAHDSHTNRRCRAGGRVGILICR